jgi:hypothetical protein
MENAPLPPSTPLYPPPDTHLQLIAGVGEHAHRVAKDAAPAVFTTVAKESGHDDDVMLTVVIMMTISTMMLSMVIGTMMMHGHHLHHFPRGSERIATITPDQPTSQASPPTKGRRRRGGPSREPIPNKKCQSLDKLIHSPQRRR